MFLSGLAPDAEFAQGQSAFSTQAGLYFEFLDITRGEAGFSEATGWLFFRIELFGRADSDIGPRAAPDASEAQRRPPHIRGEH